MSKQCHARALIPPPRNGRLRGDRDRDDALRIIRAFGGGKAGRSMWGKLTGYSMRVLVEAAFSRMKRLFGDRLFSKTFERQEVENRLRCLIMNKMLEKQQTKDWMVGQARTFGSFLFQLVDLER